MPENKNLLYAKQVLLQENLTNVLYDGKEIIKSTNRGVAPLLTLLDSGRDLSGFVSADKVIGRAAAFLYVLLETKALYTITVSKPALQVLKDNGIQVYCENCTELIKNRTGDGLCPMEQAVMDISDPKTALTAIKQKLNSLSQNN